uniref:Carbohydrate kinase FGGY N-terminal domain-containing protein n=1 Tax=Setaria digitata TaxID=48799 RepID=A0A915PHH9_9BILA
MYTIRIHGTAQSAIHELRVALQPAAHVAYYSTCYHSRDADCTAGPALDGFIYWGLLLRFRLFHWFELKRSNLISIHFKGTSEDGIRVEIDPELLWKQLIALVSELLDKTQRDARAIAGMGISCQRNTFICWNKENGEPCHRLVTWKDCRAREECKKWNNSWSLKALNLVGYFLHLLTRSARCMAARIFSFVNAMVTHRFLITLAENEEMQRLLQQGKLAFGCLDTWLIYKLSGGIVYISEPSNASSTGLFDPYTMNWGYSLLQFFSFPTSVLPHLTFSAGVRLAVTEEKLFGAPIVIAATAGDQQSALFACGCWMENDIVVSLGTGSFVDINTGGSPHSSLKGTSLYIYI